MNVANLLFLIEASYRDADAQGVAATESFWRVVLC